MRRRKFIDRGLTPEYIRSTVREIDKKADGTPPEWDVNLTAEVRAMLYAFRYAQRIVNLIGTEDGISGRPPNTDLDSIVDIPYEWYERLDLG